MTIRLCKAALVAAMALFFTLVAFGNVTDPGTNLAFVRHVLAMDTIFPDSTLGWRAIHNTALQVAGFAAIVLWEAATAVVLWLGALRLVLARGTAAGFAAARPLAVVGLTMGVLLYALGFVVIGGEWFAMWQSKIWNGQATAFGFTAMIGLVLVVLLMPEAD